MGKRLYWMRSDKFGHINPGVIFELRGEMEAGLDQERSWTIGQGSVLETFRNTVFTSTQFIYCAPFSRTRRFLRSGR